MENHRIKHVQPAGTMTTFQKTQIFLSCVHSYFNIRDPESETLKMKVSVNIILYYT